MGCIFTRRPPTLPPTPPKKTRRPRQKRLNDDGGVYMGPQGVYKGTDPEGQVPEGATQTDIPNDEKVLTPDLTTEEIPVEQFTEETSEKIKEETEEPPMLDEILREVERAYEFINVYSFL